MGDIDESLRELPDLVRELSSLREETMRHSQLATARENLKHIFNVPETVRTAAVLITEAKLLDAHKSLVELENSRDDLLFELHKLPNQSPADKELLKEYFEPVTDLSVKMEKQIRFILMRTLNTARREPKVLVTALRIIEREEKADQECLQRLKSTGFVTQGRPKKWKETGLEVLRNNVGERIEGNQLEGSRDENKMWLVRSLERIRQVTLEDLRIAKSQCQPCFPPHYHIMEHFILLYHEALSNRLLDIVASGLEGQEYVTVLSWIIQTYPGRDLMGDLSLQIPADKVRPLLDPDTIITLQREYLENMQKNYNDWMRNTLAQEVDDWKKEEDPERDNEGCFHTSAPIIVYQMIDENLQVAATISPELTHKVLVLSMGAVANYGTMYRNSIVEYKNKYFKDRTAISLFTRYMIAIVNNCQRFEELAQELKERWWKAGHHDQEATNNFEMLLHTFKELRDESSEYLLDESFLDIDVHFADLLSSKWENTTDAIDTVCATLEDYFEDYQYLKELNRERVITTAMDRVARRYITSMLQSSILRRKMSFENGADRIKAANKIKLEAMQLKAFFRQIAGDVADFDSPFDALALLSDVLKGDDMLYLEVGNLVKRYPDVIHEQLLCLLLLRGDMSKTEAKEMASEFVPEGSDASSNTLHAKSILSQVQVSSSLNPFANSEKAAAAAQVGLAAAAAAAAKNPFTKDALNPFAKE